MLESFTIEAAHVVARAIELVGIAIIAFGAIVNLGLYAVRALDTNKHPKAVADLRSNLGRSILLGLEFLVAADIINTVTLTPTLENVAVLAAIVLIRTFLSFSLELEIEGRWPWQRAHGEERSS